MERDKISVIVPVYNAETTIKRCILSITGGDRNVEVIVVDDGSTDATYDIVEKLVSIDKRVILLKQNNQGPGGARQTGLKKATGKYVAWCDSDDWYEPDCIETLYKYLIEYDADISVCRAQIPGRKIEYNSEIIQCWNRDEAIEMFLEHKLLNGVLWNKLIKRELFDKIDFDKSLWYWEDLQVVWKLLQKTKRVVKINQAKYNFFVHSESICASVYNEKRYYASQKVWNDIVEDCMKPELKSHLDEAEIRRFLWLYGDLKLMLKDGYKKKQDIRSIQKIMKATGKKGLKKIEGVQRIFAIIAIYNISLASIPFKFQKYFVKAK